MSKPLGIGIVGCGNISDIYIKNCVNIFSNMQLLALANRTVATAESQAKKYGIGRALSIDQVLNDDEIDVILNLTSPLAHSEVCSASLIARTPKWRITFSMLRPARR